MALVDDILGSVLGQLGGRAGQPGTGKALLGMAAQFIQGYPGGLPARIGAIANAGSGRQAQSCVSTGQNLPMPPRADLPGGRPGPRAVHGTASRAGTAGRLGRPLRAAAGADRPVDASPPRSSASPGEVNDLVLDSAAPHVGACMGALPLTGAVCR